MRTLGEPIPHRGVREPCLTNKDRFFGTSRLNGTAVGIRLFRSSVRGSRTCAASRACLRCAASVTGAVLRRWAPVNPSRHLPRRQAAGFAATWPAARSCLTGSNAAGGAGRWWWAAAPSRLVSLACWLHHLPSYVLFRQNDNLYKKRCRVRSPLHQSVLAWAVLAAGPLLGCGGRACAGFILPQPLPHAQLDLLSSAHESGSCSASVEEPEEGPPSRPRQRDLKPGGRERFQVGLHDSGGCASGPSSDSGGGAQSVAALVGRPPLPQRTRIGLLVLEGTESRPPPFAPSLFRPPRSV
jgi:hypothetical protein